MSRLIDAEELKTIRSINRANFNSIETIQAWIDSAPTVDAEPIRHGHWIKHGIEEGMLIEKYTCSECDYYSGTRTTNFCPVCGADMGEQDE